MDSFERLWHNAKTETQPHPKGSVGKLVNAWAKLMDAEIVDYSQEDYLASFLIDLGHLMLKGAAYNLLIVAHVPNNYNSAKEVYHTIFELAEEAKVAHCICFIIFLTEDIQQVDFNFSEILPLVFFDKKSLTNQFASKIPLEVLSKSITRQVSIWELCPFNYSEIAKGGMFVGRTSERRMIINQPDQNYLITGSKRIGKSSLMRYCFESLKRQSEYKDRIFLLSAETWTDYSSSVRQIAHELNPRKERRIDLSVKNFEYLLQEKSKNGKYPIILFVDEFDGITKKDSKRNWELLHHLNDNITRGYLRLIIAGYKEVRLLDQNLNSPLFRKLERIELGPLHENRIRHLFFEPFRTIGIQFKYREKIEERIKASFAGYPFLVHFYGAKIFNKLSKEDRIEITLEDIELFENGHELEQYLAGFLNQNLDANEMIIAMLIAFNDDEKLWTDAEIIIALEREKVFLSINDVSKACSNLIVANILTSYSCEYSFLFPILKHMIKKRWSALPLSRLYEKLKQK